VRDGIALRRWTAAAQWLLIAAAAYSGALLVNAAVALWLDAEPDGAARARRTAAAGAAVTRRAVTPDYSVILERNLFGDEPLQAAAAPAGGSEATAGPLDLRLRGTAKVDDLGYAVIEDVAAARQEVFVVGERVFDGPQLVDVRPGVAILLGGGRTQTLEIAEAAAGDAGQAARERATGNGRGRRADALDGIRQTGENAFLVDRREVEHSIENLNQIATQMRAVPFMRDGATVGFRVFNIRRNSVFDRMGLRNGDVIQRVNGVDLDSPTKALALLEDVQTSQEIRVDLVRGDAPSTLTYTVR
jgi:general secretion pathway protein C